MYHYKATDDKKHINTKHAFCEYLWQKGSANVFFLNGEHVVRNNHPCCDATGCLYTT
ncbi:hypothetical protein L610_000700000020 [Aminobacter sp. J44]|nr:hypothetical protein L610_000700000020 [Aminobacter sp. J44]